MLTYGVDDNHWPRADHLEVVRVTCSRRGHQLGRAYRLNQTLLFIARYDSGGAWRRRTDGQRLRTIEMDRRDPTLLDESDPLVSEMRYGSCVSIKLDDDREVRRVILDAAKGARPGRPQRLSFPVR